MKRNVSTIKKKLKKICSQLVIARDKKCLRCGKTERLAAAHIKSVGAYPNMRFDIDNMICLCYRCHIHWWHREILDAVKWITILKGEDFMRRLDLKARYHYTKRYSDYEQLYLFYKRKELSLKSCES